jgi:hypothetical protein
MGNKILKAYSGAMNDISTVFTAIDHVVDVYEKLDHKKVPCTDHLAEHSIKLRPSRGRYPYIITFPLGCSISPGDTTEVLDAVICVLGALVVSCDNITNTYRKFIPR